MILSYLKLTVLTGIYLGEELAPLRVTQRHRVQTPVLVKHRAVCLWSLSHQVEVSLRTPSVSTTGSVKWRRTHADTDREVMATRPACWWSVTENRATALVGFLCHVFVFHLSLLSYKSQGRVTCAYSHCGSQGWNGTVSWFQKFYTGRNCWEWKGGGGLERWLSS